VSAATQLGGQPAERGGPERDHVTATLKRCTGDVVAPMPDGRA